MPKRPQGAPKLKWTEEEELALKAGVNKCVLTARLVSADSCRACTAANAEACPAYYSGMVPGSGGRYRRTPTSRGSSGGAATSISRFEARRQPSFYG